MELELEGRTVRTRQVGDAVRDAPLAVMFANGEDGERLEEICKLLKPKLKTGECRPFIMASFSPVEWDRDFSPWPFTDRRGRRYGGEADKTLSFLLHSMIPALEACLPVGKERYAVGYSLGGLAAAYACCQGGFSGGASCSGSLWYPGWPEYAAAHTPAGRMYFSLGKKEERTRDPYMSKVGENTRGTALLMSEKAETVFVSEPGNHFYDVPGRIARGLCWLMASNKALLREGDGA